MLSREPMDRKPLSLLVDSGFALPIDVHRFHFLDAALPRLFWFSRMLGYYDVPVPAFTELFPVFVVGFKPSQAPLNSP